MRAQEGVERVLAGAIMVVRPHNAALIRRRREVAAVHALFARPALARLHPPHKQLHVRGAQQAPATARWTLATSPTHTLCRGAAILACHCGKAQYTPSCGLGLSVVAGRASALGSAKRLRIARNASTASKLRHAPCLYARFCIGASGQNTMLSVLRGSWSLIVPFLMRRSMTRERSCVSCACRFLPCRKAQHQHAMAFLSIKMCRDFQTQLRSSLSCSCCFLPCRKALCKKLVPCYSCQRPLAPFHN